MARTVSAVSLTRFAADHDAYLALHPARITTYSLCWTSISAVSSESFRIASFAVSAVPAGRIGLCG
jgi:hypothetical protein